MAHWVQKWLFWPFVKKGDHLDPNFVKNNSGNIFDHKVDSLEITLSPILGLQEHLFPFYGPLSDCCVGRGALFWPFVKKGDHLGPNFGKIIFGNIFYHKEYSLGYILSPISGLQDHQFLFYGPLSDGGLGSGAPICTLCQKMRQFRPLFWKNNFWEHL